VTEEKRYLGHARLKNEGDPVVFDEGGPAWTPLTAEERAARGEGQTMREVDLVNLWLQPEERQETWYVVRDSSCSYDINDDEARVWTLSRTPGEPGWSTDSGYHGYALKYSDARELADAANRKP
jgi:hypothetical protein